MVQELENIKNIDWFYVFIALVVLLIAVKLIVSLGEWVISKTKLETRGMRIKREEHELLITTAKNLDELYKRHEEDTKQSIRHDEIIREDLQKLTTMFVSKEIDDMRWEILDFASALSLGRQYSKEQFDHVLQIHTKYEKILEENHMENGQVTVSMQVINDVYAEKLRNGF